MCRVNRTAFMTAKRYHGLTVNHTPIWVKRESVGPLKRKTPPAPVPNGPCASKGGIDLLGVGMIGQTLTQMPAIPSQAWQHRHAPRQYALDLRTRQPIETISAATALHNS